MQDQEQGFVFFLLDTPGYWAAWFPGDVLVSVRANPRDEALNHALDRPSEFMYQITPGDWAPEQVMRMIEATGDWKVVEWEFLPLHACHGEGAAHGHGGSRAAA